MYQKQGFTSDDFANFCSKKFFIPISPFLLLHRGVQKWSFAKYCPHFSFITLVIVESKKRNIEPSSQDQEMNCIKLHQLIFSGQLNFLTLQKSLLLHKGLSQ